MTDDTTTPPSLSYRTGDGDPAGDVPALVVAWCPAQPHRAGESAVFQDLGLEHVLGRGPGDGRELRVELAPRRPGETCAASPLDDPKLSRSQLLVVPLAIGFEVRLLGAGTLRIAGTPATDGVVTFGETLLLEDRFLLLATRRPATMHLRFLPPGQRGRFGEADRFGIVGESPAVWRMLDALAFAARSGEHVFLHAETGAGKELAARAVHLLSDRAGKTFFSHNGAGIPDTLAEAELFGHEKNYPNPGMGERLGLIGDAAHSSLFLDEVGTLSHALQAKLLRVLDADGQYRRLGASRAQRAELHLIVATNSPVATLREDFVARFKQRVELPALDARPEDIPLLVRHLASQFALRSPELAAPFVETRADGSLAVRIGEDFIDALLVRDHPTNVRGLDAAVQASARQSRGRSLRAYPELLAGNRRERVSRRPALVSPGGYVRQLTDGEQAELRQLLDGTRGSVSRASDALGMTRHHQVARAAKRHGIPTSGPDEPDDDG